MTYLPKAILDTSALVCLYYLNLLSFLNLLYSEVRVPKAVEKEFLDNPISEQERTNRFSFLTSFYAENNSWFIPCNEYGDDLVQLYLSEPKMDKGEAEALAQNQFFENVYEVLLDEQTARKFAKLNNMSIHGTLYLLANLDIRFGVCNYFISVDKLKTEINTFFGDKIIKKVYQIIKERIFFF